MERVTEPELMDEEEQARAYSEADFAAPHERFVDLLVAWWPESVATKGPILDLGCGPADVTVRMAKRLPAATIHGVDGSAAMLKYGRARVKAEGLEDRVTLHQALLPRERPPLEKYPVIVSNSLLHHLHDPSSLWGTIHAFGAKGARVFVMDLMRPPTMADVTRLVDEHTRGEPDVLRRDFQASLCAAFTMREIRTQLSRAGLDELTLDVVSDRHLTVSGVLRG
jgi:cyclopropane fatty-acyl-phospholipid synthase-like methyltransferase